jgi:hypothetical protein
LREPSSSNSSNSPNGDPAEASAKAIPSVPSVVQNLFVNRADARKIRPLPDPKGERGGARQIMELARGLPERAIPQSAFRIPHSFRPRALA